ncbi:MAG TPA: hypothetical protein VGM81_01315 [Burkholderiaceae bacterium]|jgi:nucleoside-specific outer membrane channel protein Tsx
MKKSILNAARVASALAVCFTSVSHAQEAPADAGAEAPASAPAAAQHGQPTNWNDTFVGARYSSNFRFPGSAEKVTQKIGSLTTIGGFKYGNYVFNVDYLVSDGANPEAGGTKGAQETYSVGHVEFTAGKTLGHTLGFGPVRDVGLTAGYEFGSKNDAFDQRARMLMVGPTLEFAVPRGFWVLTAGWRTEKNYNGIVHADLDYKTAWHVESAWMIPFNLGPAPVVFKGFVAITGPKGTDGFHVQTKTETLSRSSLLFDVGALAGSPRTVYIGPGYEYWKNMFGTPSFEAPGTKRSAAVLVGEIHF